MTLHESYIRLSAHIPNWKKGAHFPDKVKATFSHYGFRKLDTSGVELGELDVTDLCITDEGLEISFERDDLSGVQQEISFPQEFVLEARDFLEALYATHRQYAVCRLNIYLRGKADVNSYEHIRSFELNFDTIKIERDSVSISVENEDLSTYLKSSGKTKLDIPVRDKYKDDILVETGVGEEKQLRYDRLWLNQKVVFIPVVDGSEFNAEYTGLYFYPYIYLSVANLVNLDEYDFRTQELIFTDHIEYGFYFHKAEKVETIHLSFKMRLTIDGMRRYNTTNDFMLIKNNPNTGITRIIFDEGTKTETGYEFDLEYNGNISLTAGDVLTMLHICDSPDRGLRTFTIINEAPFEITFMDKGPTLFIDVINPETLLNRILSKITNNRDYTGRIEWDDEDDEQDIRYTSRLIAAESIRNLPESNIHVSFNDFADWLKVKGFEYYIDERQIVFVKRGWLFRRNDVVLDIPAEQVADLIIEADKDNMFTGVNIGYKEQEYEENVNGRYEVNGTFSYSTNYISKSDNILNLISPFRADNIGLELLCQKTPDNAKETESNKSDNDIFEFLVYKPFFFLSPYYGVYDYEYTLSEGIRTYNTPLNPYFLMLANLSLLGVGTDKLFFKATTNFRNALCKKNGAPDVNLYDDLATIDRIFSPFTYDLATDSEIRLPVGIGLNGVINFRWKNKSYSGYLKKGVQNLNKGTEKQLVLLAIEK
jgi:hypothetical protein